MKCPYCGAEISYQEQYCPYCGNQNQEWFDFQKEIQQKINRNRLLKPFLIRQKTPELVQKMLKRILFIQAGVIFILLAFSFCLYLWNEREITRIPREGSIAMQYEQSFLKNAAYFFDDFTEALNEFIDQCEAGEIPDGDDIEYLVRRTYRALRYLEDEEEEVKEETQLLVKAFYCGYLGLPEEEISCFMPDENGEYHGYLSDEDAMPLILSIEKKLQEDVEK